MKPAEKCDLSGEPQRPKELADTQMKQVIVGICAMSKKALSRPMREITLRLQLFKHINVIFFDEKVILEDEVESWPLCDCLISFYSKGFPLEKAQKYEKLRKPFIINNLEMQYELQDRRKVYKLLQENRIPMPRYAILDRDNPHFPAELIESEDSIEINGVTFNKPFVEKPVDAEDHNIYIYYPSSTGGGSQRLFRKIGSRSSMYSSESRVRKKGSFIYEDFMPTDGTDVKVYTVGPDYAHAEARKSPALDGKVERDCEGKEIRFPVILNKEEKLISRQVCTTFKQHVCGFDLLRAGDKSCVCDVNGFSFVKSSTKYYEDCSKILGNTILRELAARLKIPWSVPFQLDDPLIVPTTFGKMMELRCVIAVIRHGDRTPKQKMKVEVRHPKFFAAFDKYDGHKKGQVKLKSPKQLQEILDIARTLLSEIDEPGASTEMKIKLEQLKTVLEMYGHFSGINRKVQMKYQPNGRPRGSSSEEELPNEPSLVLILKWGGELTPAGRSQAEELGRLFRCIYPGGEDSGPRGLGLGLLRLHSTFRHDLKIYASEEGRVQMTAAAFTKGFLALEGELTPILAQMVKSANTNGLLDNDSDASKYQNAAKQRLHELMSLDRTFTDADRAALNPCRATTLNKAMDFVKNPVECCRQLHVLIQELVTLLKEKLEGRKSQTLYYGESWELMLRRWSKIDKDFGVKDGKFDISKIPDIYDCIKFDMQHNQKLIQFPRAEKLYTMAKYLADIVVPQEYGLTSDEKLAIGRGICTPLMKKICNDLERNLNETDEEPVNRLNPRYSSGVASPGRHVKTRLYFTSESHLHGLLSCLCRGGLLQDSDEQSKRALEYVSSVSELNFMSKIVIMLYEDPTKDPFSEERFHIELHFSPGVNCCVQKNLPPGPGFRSTRSYLPSQRDFQGDFEDSCMHIKLQKLNRGLLTERTQAKVKRSESVPSPDDVTATAWMAGWLPEEARAHSIANLPLTLANSPDKSSAMLLKQLRSSEYADFFYDAMTKVYHWMPSKRLEKWRPPREAREEQRTGGRRPYWLPGDNSLLPTNWNDIDWTSIGRGQRSLSDSFEDSCYVSEEWANTGKGGCNCKCGVRRMDEREGSPTECSVRQKGGGYTGPMWPGGRHYTTQGLISTAVIRGRSHAISPPLLPTAHSTGSGFGTVPPIRPLETLHNALSLRQLIEFLRKLTGPLPAGTPPHVFYYYGESSSVSSLGSPCPSPSYLSGEGSSYSRDDSFFMRDSLEKAAASALINIHALIEKEKKDVGERDGFKTPVQMEDCDMGSLSSLPFELLAPEVDQRTITVATQPPRDSIIGFFQSEPSGN